MRQEEEGIGVSCRGPNRPGAIGLKLEAAELEALEKASALAPEYPTSMQDRLPGPRP